MKITVMGTGYVGLVSGTCFAELGNDVTCIDVDEKKIADLKNGIIPIFEPGLTELVKKNIAAGRLHFSTDIPKGIHHGEVVFSAVGTPPDKDHRADLQYVKAVAKSFGEHADTYKIFVNKSTVPVGTGQLCKDIIAEEFKKRGTDATFDIVSNPEFLREGMAVPDTLNPERIVVGSESEHAKKIMEKLYAPFDSEVIHTDIKSAEIIKYSSNSFLAAKISFINEIANFCEIVGANIEDVAKGMGADSRIGHKFLYAGIGYGGSCFPKDVQALIQTGREYNYPFRILEAVETVNNIQQKKLFHMLHESIPKLEGKTIAVLGLAFKPDTDDMRRASSVKIIKKLQAEGAHVRAYDPQATDNAKHYLSNVNLTYTTNAYEAAKNADAVLVVTEWREFANIDLTKLKETMSGDIVIDGRNMFDHKKMDALGFEYHSIGRPSSEVPAAEKR